MATVFVLINTELGAEERVLAALKAIAAVNEVYVIYGAYDVIAKVVAPTMDVVKTIISEEIRNVPEISSTFAMVVAEPSL
ncbi:MAG: Lrp/AsnC family transcriptional regulator [Candidatus Hodarchaeales archaeon]